VGLGVLAVEAVVALESDCAHRDTLRRLRTHDAIAIISTLASRSGRSDGSIRRSRSTRPPAAMSTTSLSRARHLRCATVASAWTCQPSLALA
jgi:hypothetical protein